MILDERSEFADATALSTAGTGRALFGDVIDLGGAAFNPVVPGDVGQGRDLYLVISIDTAVTSGAAASVSFELSSDAQAAIATDGTATLHYSTAAIPKATLVAGYVVAVVALPWQNPAYERFLGIVQNVVTTALTAGKVNAFLTTEPAKWSSYPDAI